MSEAASGIEMATSSPASHLGSLRGVLKAPAQSPVSMAATLLAASLLAMFMVKAWRRATRSRRRRSSKGLGAPVTAIVEDVAAGDGSRSLVTAPDVEFMEVDEALKPSHAEWNGVEALRRRVQFDPDAHALAGGERWLESAELLRFVRARKTLDEQEQLFRDSMAWRRSHAQGWGTATDEGSFGPEFRRYREGKAEAPDWWAFLETRIPQVLYGADRNGLPIFYTAPGQADLMGCQREVGYEALERYAVMENDVFLDCAREETRERCHRCMGGHQVLHGGYVIVNLEGLSWRHLGEAKVFNKMAAAAKILHPERQHRCFIVRAPQAFAAVWRMIKPLVDPRTAARITIFGADDHLQPMIEELGVENVPDFLGGSLASLPAHVKPGAQQIPRGAFKQFCKSRS